MTPRLLRLTFIVKGGDMNPQKNLEQQNTSLDRAQTRRLAVKRRERFLSRAKLRVRVWAADVVTAVQGESETPWDEEGFIGL